MSEGQSISTVERVQLDVGEAHQAPGYHSSTCDGVRTIREQLTHTAAFS